MMKNEIFTSGICNRWHNHIEFVKFVENTKLTLRPVIYINTLTKFLWDPNTISGASLNVRRETVTAGIATFPKVWEEMIIGLVMILMVAGIIPAWHRLPLELRDVLIVMGCYPLMICGVIIMILIRVVIINAPPAIKNKKLIESGKK